MISHFYLCQVKVSILVLVGKISTTHGSKPPYNFLFDFPNFKGILYRECIVEKGCIMGRSLPGAGRAFCHKTITGKYVNIEEVREEVRKNLFKQERARNEEETGQTDETAQL